ncbi:MAG: PAS domain S-box protein, partial [Phormidesmis sp.]
MSRLSAVSLSTAELEQLFDLVSDLICVLDASGCCRQINLAFRQTLGYSTDDLYARPLTALVHPGDQASHQAEIDRLLADQSDGQSDGQLTGRYRTQTGDWRSLTWQISAINGTRAMADNAQASRMLYCVARDVTPDETEPSPVKSKADLFNTTLERQVEQSTEQIKTARYRHLDLLQAKRQADERIEQSQAELQLYANAVQNMQIGFQIWQLESADDAHSLRLIVTNPAASELIGVPVEDIVGKPILEAFPAFIDSEVPQIYADMVRSGQKHNLGEVSYEDERVEKGIFSVKAFPLPDRCVGIVFENITVRKQQEALRQEKQTQLRIIFEQAAVGMARLNSGGQWIQVNQRLCDLLGYSMPELLQTNAFELTHPDDVSIAQAHYQQLINGEKLHAGFEKRYLTKDGEVLWTQVTASPVCDQQGQLLYFITTIQGITQRKQANLALRSQKNDLLKAHLLLTRTMAALEQRNQELDQFAYVTSHDLKAPLRAIANLATWIEEDLGDHLPPENKEQLDLLTNRVHRMEGLINGLLKYSR